MSESKTESANVGQVKEHLSAYLAQVEQGTKVVVCRRNRPVAEIVPAANAPRENRTRLGSATGSVVVKCDLTAPAMDQGDWDMLT
jgi:prevent-host-death family protein